MANYNKSFNFRNGVQVDDDNFVVNANGLVGIGTSIPTEILDVYGTAKITGLVTANNVSTPLLNVTGIATIINLNVGIISASSGIATYYGDGSNLINIPTSQWVDVNLGFGFTSIYAAGNVGVQTNLPYFSFQVGGDTFINPGVGIDSIGNVKLSGIITAGYFVGDGSNLAGLNASNIVSGTVSNSILPSNISIGIITATSLFGNLTGTASSALSIIGSPNITVSNVNAGIITASNINSNFSNVGVSTVSTRFYAPLIGVGTNSPTSNIHIRDTNSVTLQLTSDTAESIVILGRNVSQTTNNAALLFGNTSPLYSYSNSKSLDIINYDTGNINNYLHLGSSGIGTGSFNWLYGQNLSNLMSLTYAGNLGLGITNPTNRLHVVGTSTVTGNSYVGNNFYVKNDLTVDGFTYSDLVGDLSGNVTGNVIGNVTGNVNSSGLSTFSQVLVNTSVGIGTTNSRCAVDFADSGFVRDKYMLPPRITTNQRTGLSTVAGAIIYNTITNKHQGYNGTAWFDFY